MGTHLSPFLIPLGGLAVAIVAIISGVVAETHSKRLKAEQRLAMLARGMSADDIDKLLSKSNDDGKRVKDPIQTLVNTRRAGIILMASGIGFVLFFLALTAVLQVHEVLSGAAAGLVPIAIGVGFLIDYKLQKRDLSRFGLEVESAE